MMPIKCTLCCKRFADFGSCDKHVTTVHIAKQTTSSKIVPRAMSVKELKEELRNRNKGTSGTKADLVLRLEGAL